MLWLFEEKAPATTKHPGPTKLLSVLVRDAAAAKEVEEEGAEEKEEEDEDEAARNPGHPVPVGPVRLGTRLCIGIDSTSPRGGEPEKHLTENPDSKRLNVGLWTSQVQS